MSKNYIELNWVKDAIFYQIFPDRFYNGNLKNDPPGVAQWESLPTRNNFFGGDLEGIKKKLLYLKETGINAIYLNPVFKAGTNHKYDTWDYFSIDPAFGSESELIELVNKAHNLHIKVILDGVFNHCGDGFWAFKDVLEKGKKSKYYDWFFILGDKIIKDPVNYQTAGGCEYLPKLNVNNQETRKYIFEAVSYWTKNAKIDGWRLDVPWKISFDFWKNFRELVKIINPESYLVGEIWRDPEFWIHSDTFDGVMNYKLRDLIIDFCIRDSLDAEDFDYELKYLSKIMGQKIYFMLNLLSSHDTPRILTLANNDVSRVILAITFLMTYIGVPMIYYGDEIGMEGGNDPDCRRTMIWDESLWNKKINNTYKKLIDLRLNHSSLRTGEFVTLLVFNRFYSYLRSDSSDNIIVVINAGERQPDLEIPLPNKLNANKIWVDILSEKYFEVLSNRLILKNITRYTSYVLKPVQTFGR
ncbi:MAG: glycoside hydrolase family 13 protein [Actinobacteria bacterium]|nr:glycoside hydrolase family 13 protein [Cyanobacteriota bacterium]MCL5771035.1 glycoside hydrolase family 13 protein [Actinomycetota bacterium]